MIAHGSRYLRGDERARARMRALSRPARLAGGLRQGGLALALTCIVAIAACGPRATVQSADQDAEHWVATWRTALQLTEPRNMPPAPGLSDNTLRQLVHVSIPGRRLRVHLSNVFGSAPVVIHAAHIARPTAVGRSTIVPGSDRALTFAGQAEVTIPAGQAVVSDPFDYDLPVMSDVALTLAYGSTSPDITGHPSSRTTSFIAPGNQVSAVQPTGVIPTEHWFNIAGIDVVAPPQAAAVAVLGNSIADGRGSTTDHNDRISDDLERRLQANPATRDVAMLAVAIGGNCVLRFCLGPSALDRLQRDVLDQPGIRWLIVFEGVNDIGGARGEAASDSVAQGLIAGYQQIVRRAHARGIKVYGATITPFGTSFYDRPGHEQARETVNRWIRTGGAFDAVIDLDAAIRDPADPTRLPDASTVDHLHPNAAGYQKLADAVDLSLFTR